MRSDRTREHFHLQQLNLDAGLNAAELRRMAEHHTGRAEELMFAIGVLKRGGINPDESERFKWGILTMFQYPPVEITTGAYDALVAPGDFSVLRDNELRAGLVRLQSYFDALEKRVNTLTDRGRRADFISENVAYAVPHPSGSGVSWRVDFEALRGNRGALALLASERRNHSIVGEAYATGAELSAEIENRTKTLIGAD